MYRLVLSLAVAAAVGMAAPAYACVPCGSGDPTLTVMGAEAPLAGRARLSLELQGRWDGVAAPSDPARRVELLELRAALSASYAPTRWLTVSATLPVLLRDLRFGGHAHYTTLGPGDAELRARVILLEDAAFAPENVLGVSAGVRLPTSIDQAGSNGLLPVDAQTGSGAIDPLLGLVYAHFADPWSFFATATVSLPVGVRFADVPGPSLSTTTALQYRFDGTLTLRLGVDTRFDAPVTIDGRTDPRSTHFSLFVSPDLLWSPASDWIVQLGVRAPVVQGSEQGREEGWYVRAAVTVDLM